MREIYFLSIFICYKNYISLFSDIMTVIKHFNVAFSNNFIGYKLMHVKYIGATAAKSLICTPYIVHTQYTIHST